VRLVSYTAVGFSGVVGTVVEVAAEGGAAGGGVAGAVSASSDKLTAAGGVGADTTPSSGYAYILSVDCGPVLGLRRLSCGVGMEGAVVTYACPLAVPTPRCLWYSSASRQWSGEGTAVVSVGTVSITCNTTHFAPHAARFAALVEVQRDVFTAAAPLTLVTPITFSVASFCALALCTALLALGVFCQRSGAQALRFASEVAARLPWLASKRVDAYSAPSPSAVVVPLGSGEAASTTLLAAAAPPPQSPPPQGATGFLEQLQARVWERAGRVAALEALPPPPTAASLALFVLRLLPYRLAATPPLLAAPVWSLLGGRAYFHPHTMFSAPAPTRFLSALASALCSLLGAVILYVYLLGSKAAPGTLVLPGLSGTQAVGLAVGVALIFVAPCEAVLGLAAKAVLQWVARERYPEVLVGELARRRAVEGALKGLSTAVLEDAPQAAAEAARVIEMMGGGGGEEKRGAASPNARRCTIVRGALLFSALNVFLFCVAIFASFYLYAFAMARGAIATSHATLSWVLGVAVYMFAVRPMALALQLFAEMGRPQQRQIISGGGGGRVEWGGLEVGLLALDLPSASSAASGFQGGEARAVAGLAPVAALLVSWHVGVQAAGGNSSGARLIHEAYLSASSPPPHPHVSKLPSILKDPSSAKVAEWPTAPTLPPPSSEGTRTTNPSTASVTQTPPPTAAGSFLGLQSAPPRPLEAWLGRQAPPRRESLRAAGLMVLGPVGPRAGPPFLRSGAPSRGLNMLSSHIK
jgi:hypothetical protein